jgi:hypothetical protein
MAKQTKKPRAAKSATKNVKTASRKAAKVVVPQTEWIKERLFERGITIDQMSARWGVEKHIAYRVLNGSRTIDVAELVAAMEALDLSLADTARRFGFDVPRGKVPLAGKVNGDSRVLPADSAAFHLDCPEDVPPDVKALVVDAPNSKLAMFDGAVMYFRPHDGIEEQAMHRLAVIESPNLPAPVVGMILPKGTIHKTHRVTLMNAATIELAQITTASPILWIKYS